MGNRKEQKKLRTGNERIEIQYIIFDVTLERLDLNTIFVMFCAGPAPP